MAPAKTIALDPFDAGRANKREAKEMFSVDAANRPNYYKYLARLNFEAAKSADDYIGHWPGYEIAAPPPVMTLCAHSIELSLKAFLLDQGIDEDTVRKLSHDLMACWEMCEALGADIKDLDKGVLAIVSDLLASGRLRYGEKSKLGKVPVFGPLTTLCDQCLDLCGAPKTTDIMNR